MITRCKNKLFPVTEICRSNHCLNNRWLNEEQLAERWLLFLWNGIGIIGASIVLLMTVFPFQAHMMPSNRFALPFLLLIFLTLLWQSGCQQANSDKADSALSVATPNKGKSTSANFASYHNKNIYELILMNEPIRPIGTEPRYVQLPKGIDVPQGMKFVSGRMLGKEGENTHFVDGFFLDNESVCVFEFQEFVEATGYVTTAELKGFSWVYEEENQVWEMHTGVSWKDGAPDSHVVHVSAFDAEAYCQWAGKRLMTNVEWLANHQQLLQSHNFTVFKDNWMMPDQGELEPKSYSHTPITGHGAPQFWEWTGTWLMEQHHQPASLVPDAYTKRVVRQHDAPNSLTGGNTVALLPTSTSSQLGFRCVRSLD